MLVIPPEAGWGVAAFGSVAMFQLEGSQTAGNLCLAFAETPPGVGPPPHVHHRDDELFLVLQGEAQLSHCDGMGEDDAGNPGGRVVRRRCRNPDRLQTLAREHGYEFLPPGAYPPPSTSR